MMWEYRALFLYNEISVLQQNNIKGRYDSRIAEIQLELYECLEHLGRSE